MSVTLPRTIKVMLAKGGGQPFDDDRFGFEIKFDGIRCLVVADQPQRLQTRHQSIVTSRFPELSFAHLPQGVVIDGEIIVWKDGAPSFQLLSRRFHTQSQRKAELGALATPATFIAFDLLYLDFASVVSEPLATRRAMLAELLDAHPHEALVLVDQVIGRGKAYFTAVAERLFEGVIAKRLDSRYRAGKRSATWRKIVAWRQEPLRVLGWVKGGTGLKEICVGRPSGDGWQYLGRLSVPSADRDILLQAMRNAPRAHPPQGAPAGAVDWRDLDLQCEVRFFLDPITPRLRQASFKGWVG